MIFRRVAFLLFLVALSAALGLFSLSPAASTVDVNAQTDIVDFQTSATLLNQPNVLALDSALVCIEGSSPPDNLTRGAKSGGCLGQLEPSFEGSFSGVAELSGSVRIVMRRVRQTELEISLIGTPNLKSIVLRSSEGKSIAVDHAVIVLTKSYFDTGNIFSFATTASRLMIGGDGRTFGSHRGLFLLGGIATPLSNTIFGAHVVRGSPVPLSAGDMINWMDTKGYASVFARAGSDGAIEVSAHFPTKETVVRSFAGTGIPLSVSWLDRVKTDPVLLLLLALLGFAMSVPDWMGRISKLVKYMSSRKGQRRSNLRYLCFFASILAVFVLFFPALSHSQSVYVKGLDDGQGYIFNSNGRCYVITALHVVESKDHQRISATIRIEFGETKIDAPVNPPSNLPPQWIKPWRYQDIDIALVDIGDETSSPCKIVSPRILNDIPKEDELIFARESGAYDYIPVKVTDSNNARLVIRDFGKCLFKQGRSGSLVVLQGSKILGFLTDTSDCTGLVVPIDAINDALQTQARIQMPIHSRSDELVRAAYLADESQFIRLLDTIGDPNTIDGSGHSPLLAVAAANEPGSFVANKPNCISRTNSRVRIADEILKRGGRVDGSGGNSWTPLINAVWDEDSHCGNRAMIEFLLRNNANPNQIYRDGDRFHTVLHSAVEEGSVDAVRLLLAFGADSNVADNWGKTPIMAIITNDPTWPSSAGSCDTGENIPVQKFKLLVASSNLDLPLPDREYGPTARKALQTRASTGGTPGIQRCFQQMLSTVAH
ncbi:ankyrin repeat domain-containing protein (plasmid) [Rhizobium sp. Pop5]|uniref:ankyrin repeat domain-containing protein n=1 Tax=Rhizobium sp. Pop5 TaxID=1223565 RepID=UPI000283BBBB|nr:ankyrin repeat domain-containing protein [Rhizobium sp. Pop5]EJZ17858.1 ankyrin [Rhizobium sp. Pop5]UVD54876.1 ankyrin repeat domain-containing protein [Rhizobium sp. Pop5]